MKIYSKNCSNCDYWLRKYHQCEHPDQRNEESGAYDAPPDKHCELWESAEVEE